ncbi:50S ribosomal protein L13 [Myxococcota bacterium]|nr:50S ribosomal protein L13 [Myxococcota bacterium]MBU1536815.1 50S ribosomal protein L13 [Myxococcota bacterium]
MNKTYSAKTDEVERKWYVIDLEGEVLGRAATKIATLLRGKHKPQFTPHIDTGDFVIVLNADKVKLTGNKWANKVYYKHSGYIGGLRSFTANEMRDRHPERIVQFAVRGMLPKTKLGNKMIKKLKVYTGTEHVHAAQTPVKISIGEIR